jgi:signal transduction histidine kinase
VLNNTTHLFWVYNEDNHLVYANKVFFQKTGINESKMGLKLHQIAKDKKIADLIKLRIEETKQKGGMSSFTDEITGTNSIEYYQSHWFIVKNQKEVFVAGYAADITDRKKQGQEIKKLSSRLAYFNLNTSDIIWEWDTKKRRLHITDKINEICGTCYTQLRKQGISFWLKNVIKKSHQRQVLQTVAKAISNGTNKINLAYTIIGQNNEEKEVEDCIYVIYHARQVVRVYGAIRDVTERKVLQKKLKDSKNENDKAINAAAVKAQEMERDRISKELHDNVNQLILSAKMHISIAKEQPQNADDLLSKAISYQMEALEECKRLSRNMSVAVLENNEIIIKIEHIFSSLQSFGLTVFKQIDPQIGTLLNSTQQIMIIRILQEQTANIIKYANAQNVYLRIYIENRYLKFFIIDDGIGFEPKKIKNGIGLANIKSRVVALGGVLEIETSPGNGCKLSFRFTY